MITNPNTVSDLRVAKPHESYFLLPVQSNVSRTRQTWPQLILPPLHTMDRQRRRSVAVYEVVLYKPRHWGMGA